MVGCDLYDLNSGGWSSFQISSQCSGCGVVGIGRYWVKLASPQEYQGPYPYPPTFWEQNISTGQLMSDPITPGGTVFDDLNAPSGSSPLCPPLHYPTAQQRYATTTGGLTFLGSGPNQFALTAGIDGIRLRRCHSNLNLVVPHNAYGGIAPMASSWPWLTAAMSISFPTATAMVSKTGPRCSGRTRVVCVLPSAWP